MTIFNSHLGCRQINRPKLIGWYCQLNSPKLVKSADEYLQATEISVRYHLLRCLALLSVQSQARGNSHRDIEDLLAERGITVTRESIRLWCIKFGAIYARRLKRKHRGYGDTFFIDEVFVKINGKQHYLWRAVDQDGEVVDVYLQAKRDGAAAKVLPHRLSQFPASGLAGRHIEFCAKRAGEVSRVGKATFLGNCGNGAFRSP